MEDERSAEGEKEMLQQGGSMWKGMERCHACPICRVSVCWRVTVQ